MENKTITEMPYKEIKLMRGCVDQIKKFVVITIFIRNRSLPIFYKHYVLIKFHKTDLYYRNNINLYLQKKNPRKSNNYKINSSLSPFSIPTNF